LEQLADSLVPLMPSDAGALPDTVGREQRRDFRGIVIVVADAAVASLEFLDRLDVFERRDPFFELADIHRAATCPSVDSRTRRPPPRSSTSHRDRRLPTA